MQHETPDQERQLLLPSVGTFQLEELISHTSVTKDAIRLTSVHSIGAQKLVSILDSLRHINAAIGEGIDSVPLVQISAVSVERQVMILVVVPDAVKLLYKWDACPL